MIITPTCTRCRAGFALLLVMIMVAVSIIILAADMYRTNSVAIMNNANNTYSTDCYAAEAAVEKVYARMACDFRNGLAAVSNNMTLGLYATNVPTANENRFWANFQFSDAQGNVGKTYVNYAYSYTGPLPSAYSGLNAANSPVYRIISNVQMTNGNCSRVIGAAQEDVLLAQVPLSNWAIFYNGLLEFSDTSTMTVKGRVHANGPIYVGTINTSLLTFNSPVSTTATLTAPLVSGIVSGWTPGNPSTWNTTFNATPGYTTNIASVTVTLNMTNSHFLIDMPPGGELPTSVVGAQRLYNQAQMVLTVTNPSASVSTNLTVQLTLQSSYNGTVPGNDPAKDTTSFYFTNATPAVLSSNLPFLSITNISYDHREYATNLFTQIDVGKLNFWMTNNATVQGKLPAANGIYPTILYVADNRTHTRTRLPSVRLVNAAQLPANGTSTPLGFTVATPNPLYVLGNYNIQNSAGSATGGNNAYEVPAALFSDALTLLSSNWTDSEGFTNYVEGSARFAAANDTVNAAIITGSMPSTNNTFSGGVHNLPRLLEDWATNTNKLVLNTSIIRLWNSAMATNQFRWPSGGGFSPAPVNPYYNAPNPRNYNFDNNFLDPNKVPPGIPHALVCIRFAWGVPPPNTTTYTPAHD